MSAVVRRHWKRIMLFVDIFFFFVFNEFSLFMEEQCLEIKQDAPKETQQRVHNRP